MGRKVHLLLACIILVAIGGLSTYFLSQKNNDGQISKEGMQALTDSVGKPVTLPLHPKRVVMLNASNLEIYYAVGGSVVGKPNSMSYDKALQEKIKDVPEIGAVHNPSLEKILALKPDLVIGANIPFHNAMLEPLQNAGIPLFINSIEAYEDVTKTLDFYGNLANKKEQAENVRARLLAEYQEATKSIDTEKAPRTLIIFGSPDSFSMATSKSFAGDLLTRLGGKNIADLDKSYTDMYVPLSMEYITQKDPEVIMLITMGNPRAVTANFYQKVEENTIWEDVSAVKSKRIHQLPAHLFTVNPGTKVTEAMNILAGFIYPKEAK